MIQLSRRAFLGGTAILTGTVAVEAASRLRIRLRGGGTFSPADTTIPSITNTDHFSFVEGTTHDFFLSSNETVTWGIFSGADAAHFSIVDGNKLRIGPKNFSSPDDADTNGIYRVVVQATDLALNTNEKTIDATLLDDGVVQDTAWNVPEEDITWWPSEARPAMLGEQRFKAFGIGPADAPAPAALPGTFTEVSTQAALVTALANASVQNIVCRAGTYNGQHTITRDGPASNNRITIRAYPGEERQVIFFNGYAELTVPNSLWELHDAGRKIWRTTAATYGTSQATNTCARGYIETPDGRFIWLVPYLGLTALSSDTQSINNYMGPGVCHHTDGRVYVRFADLSTAVAKGDFSGWLAVADRDPNDLKMWISGSHNVLALTGCENIEFQDIIIRGSHTAVYKTGTTKHIYFLRCQVEGCMNGFSNRFGAHSFSYFEYGAVRSHMPQWVSREIHKAEGDPPGQYRPRCDTVAFHGDPDGFGPFEDHYVRHSRITDYIDCSRVAPEAGSHKRLEFTNCYVRSIDDFSQISTRCEDVVHAYCFIHGPAVGAQGTSVSATNPGRWYIHHNVIDTRFAILYHWSEARVVREIQANHNTDITNWPVQFYNNTIIGAGETENSPKKGTFGGGGGGNVNFKAHFMNNIMVQTTWGGTPGYFHYDIVVQRTQATPATSQGMHIVDGNLYNRQGTAYNYARFQNWIFPTTSDFDVAFANIAAFRAHAFKSVTDDYYAPGWEASSAEVPDIADLFTDFAQGNLQPPSGSPADGALIDLTAYAPAANWPNRDSPFVGAIAPL